jgi:ribA/ribD-fused uncharacterized protein
MGSTATTAGSSNFYPSAVVLDGAIYPSVEHAYQAAKFIDPVVRREFMDMTAGQAKRRGAKKTGLRPDWEEIKVGVMTGLIRQKFQHESFRDKLLETEDRYIEETNHWGDRFWGVCEGKGENVLGKIIMEIREEIRGTMEAHLAHKAHFGT